MRNPHCGLEADAACCIGEACADECSEHEDAREDGEQCATCSVTIFGGTDA
jgi:hypothetical protein